jgi:hypothetical protein
MKLQVDEGVAAHAAAHRLFRKRRWGRPPRGASHRDSHDYRGVRALALCAEDHPRLQSTQWMVPPRVICGPGELLQSGICRPCGVEVHFHGEGQAELLGRLVPPSRTAWQPPPEQAARSGRRLVSYYFMVGSPTPANRARCADPLAYTPK